MEQIAETAKAYYANLSENRKQSAINLFKKIDTNGDGKISFDEYVQYFKKFKSMSSPEFFQKLDRDGNGMLDFDQFITAHYICAADRVYTCDGCKVFLDGTYFTCVRCFEGYGNTFDLCCACYRDKNYNHPQHTAFLDNYTLLQTKRERKLQKKGVSDTLGRAEGGIEAVLIASEVCSQM